LSSACSSSFTAAAAIITATGPQLFLAPCEVPLAIGITTSIRQ
jgi:hypothetical protein